MMEGRTLTDAEKAAYQGLKKRKQRRLHKYHCRRSLKDNVLLLKERRKLRREQVLVGYVPAAH